MSAGSFPFPQHCTVSCVSFDVVLEIVVYQSFLPFILEAEQKGSILRQDSVLCIVAWFSFTNNTENITTSKGTGKTGPWAWQQGSEHPALASLRKILPLFSG